MSYKNKQKFERVGDHEIGRDVDGSPIIYKDPKCWIDQILLTPDNKALIDVKFSEGDGLNERTIQYEIENQGNNEALSLNENSGMVTITFASKIFGPGGHNYLKDFTKVV